ncbi:MAG: nucleoside triphosphate pyrophosphohydrolase [Gemmatimonadetes bacterium]|jgi:MazG family protein|nr:nucleoside triphosphate pyrophosphohydrolase [Gemmatimonadota bacterium]
MTEGRTKDDGVEHHFPGPGALDRAVRLVRYLREHCPWAREQTAESLIPHLLEETHEVVDAIRDGSVHELEGELGDLLLNLAFQIVVAEEGALLNADSVYGRLEKKMIHRHPHLFGDGDKQDWETLKAAERDESEGVLSGLAKGLDPLTKSFRIQERVAAVGFDWDDYRGPLDKVAEELEEVREAIEADDAVHVEEEIGDLLFAVVNLARLAGPHPTTALARANQKFQNRFERLEALAGTRGISLATAGLQVLDGLWDELKVIERSDEVQ